MALVIFLLTFSLSAWSQSCPASKSLNYLPVHDQDGLGTCASNTAALMMQYNLGLERSPSYMQMSLTYSGLTNNNGSDFFYNDENGRRRLFNWGAQICGVIDQSQRSGFCDSNQMGFDHVGSTDPFEQQESFLTKMATFLGSNQIEILLMRDLLANPQTRAEAERRVAYFFANRASMCTVPKNEFMSRRALARLKPYWESFLTPPASTTQRQVARRMLDLTFLPNGQPRPAALTYHQEFLASISGLESRLEQADEANVATAGIPGVMNESMFTVWWGNRNDVTTSSIPQQATNSYLSDYRAYAPCRDPAPLTVLSSYLNAPSCVVPTSATISPAFLTQARQLVASLSALSENRLDPQAGLVNLISPACAGQMEQRAGDYAGDCNDRAVNSASSSNTAKSTSVEEICAGRAVGISICTGFFKASVPVDSKFCDEDEPGVADHGRHAVTLIGYRPRPNGTRQFLVQNSWGSSCPFRQGISSNIPAALQGLVECEVTPGAIASPTGRFWVDENLLFNNTYQLSTYRP